MKCSFIYWISVIDSFAAVLGSWLTDMLKNASLHLLLPPPFLSSLLCLSTPLCPALKGGNLHLCSEQQQQQRQQIGDELIHCMERERERVLHLCTVSFLISFSVADLSSSSVFTAPVMDPRTAVFISNLLLLTAGECPFSLEGTRQIHRLVRWPHRGLILSCDDGMSDCLLVQTDVCSPQVAFASSSGWV